MNLEIYKKGQGKVARFTAYVLGGILLVFGAFRLYATFNVPGQHVFVQDLPVLGDLSAYKIAAFMALFLGALVWHVFLNRPDIVDLLIDTEQEMRRVSWPSRKDVRVSTLVVVAVTFIMGMALFGFDQALQYLFRLIFST